MAERSWLRKTRQETKLIVGVLVVPLAGITAFVAGLERWIPFSNEWQLAFLVGGPLLAAGAIARTAWSIRCRECGARPLWQAMRERGAGTWLTWLRSQTRCPVCGNDGAVSRP